MPTRSHNLRDLVAEDRSDHKIGLSTSISVGMTLTGSLNGMNISKKTSIKALAQSITGVALTLLISTTAFAAVVDIAYEGVGTSTSLSTYYSGSVTAGLSEVTIDGKNRLALNTENKSMSGTWTATETSYADVQNGGGKYNNGRDGATKYAQAGYLFSTLDLSESLSAVAAKHNALVNYVIWYIMDYQAPYLARRQDQNKAYNLYRKASRQSNFDWSSTMEVYTANDRGTTREFFAVLPPIATPIPGALFLFGSMALGLFGIVTRRRGSLKA